VRTIVLGFLSVVGCSLLLLPLLVQPEPWLVQPTTPPLEHAMLMVGR
jgi:hypothetical protein